MVFLRITTEYAPEKDNELLVSELDPLEKRRYAAEFCDISEELYHKLGGKSQVFVTAMKDSGIQFGAVAESCADAEKAAEMFMQYIPFEFGKSITEEIGFEAFRHTLYGVERRGYIQDRIALLNRFGVDSIAENSHFFYDTVIGEEQNSKEDNSSIHRLVFSDTLNSELERIEMVQGHKTIVGHPVHYIVQTDSHEMSEGVCKTLLGALYKNKRLKSKRCSWFEYSNDYAYPEDLFEGLYHLNMGGAVVINYRQQDIGDSEFAGRGKDTISKICRSAVKYKNSTLTIICFSKASESIKEEFMCRFDNTAFVEITEDMFFGDRAQEYLKVLAKAHKIRTDKKLFETLSQTNKGYTASEINRIFNQWFDHKIRNFVYPQYKSVSISVNQIKNKKPRGDAYGKLHALIGLEKAKELMDNSINYFKAQKVFAQRGVASTQPAMHMVFTGNPGTAKTTVARLFAEIMKDNNMLSRGEIYEVGRADLVGKFVGSTAPLVKAAFKRAKGGVLFIDEAYSLVDDRDGLFGDEAINTIVQEMENNRLDTVVIFAGYPDKMERFLQKNPGLRSRIAFHVHFEDYSTQELCDIAEHTAKEKGLIIAEDARNKLREIFNSVKGESDFGNGRFVRNIIEKALMSQANRLMKSDAECLSDTELKTLCAEDIEAPKSAKKLTVQIGFCA